MIGPKTDNQITDGDGNSQVGHNSGTIHVGIDPKTFVEEMRRKDDHIKDLIAEKDALKDQVAGLEKAQLEAELAQLRSQKEGLAARMASPDAAFAEHKQRATQIENLLADVATQQAIGENRIRAALVDFAELEYDAIDALLEESENRGIMLAANSAFGRGLVAEDAVKWADAAAHYARAASLSATYDHLYKASHFAMLAGDFATGLRFAQEMEGKARAEGDKSNLSLALDRAAAAFQNSGNYAAAEPMFREALALDGELEGKETKNYATGLNNLAGLLRATGRYEEAEPLYREALEIDRKTLGEAHPNYAIDLNNLALLLRATGRYEEAEPLYREALEIGRKTVGAAHPTYAIRLNNLAGLLRATGRYEEAEPLFREALAVFEAALGAEHPNTVTVAGNLERFLAARP